MKKIFGLLFVLFLCVPMAFAWSLSGLFSPPQATIVSTSCMQYDLALASANSLMAQDSTQKCSPDGAYCSLGMYQVKCVRAAQTIAAGSVANGGYCTADSQCLTSSVQLYASRCEYNKCVRDAPKVQTCSSSLSVISQCGFMGTCVQGVCIGFDVNGDGVSDINTGGGALQSPYTYSANSPTVVSAIKAETANNVQTIESVSSQIKTTNQAVYDSILTSTKTASVPTSSDANAFFTAVENPSSVAPELCLKATYVKDSCVKKVGETCNPLGSGLSGSNCQIGAKCGLSLVCEYDLDFQSAFCKSGLSVEDYVASIASYVGSCRSFEAVGVNTTQPVTLSWVDKNGIPRMPEEDQSVNADGLNPEGGVICKDGDTSANCTAPNPVYHACEALTGQVMTQEEYDRCKSAGTFWSEHFWFIIILLIVLFLLFIPVGKKLRRRILKR